MLSLSYSDNFFVFIYLSFFSHAVCARSSSSPSAIFSTLFAWHKSLLLNFIKMWIDWQFFVTTQWYYTHRENCWRLSNEHPINWQTFVRTESPTESIRNRHCSHNTCDFGAVRAYWLPASPHLCWSNICAFLSVDVSILCERARGAWINTNTHFIYFFFLLARLAIDDRVVKIFIVKKSVAHRHRSNENGKYSRVLRIRRA